MGTKGKEAFMKNILKYPGSKWRIAKQLVALIPNHHTYLEPFFGSGAVYFTKTISNIEVINDLDFEVVNLFRCLKQDADLLARLVASTPYAREEYDATFETTTDDAFERALLFLVKCWQGHGFRTTGEKVGWKNDVVGRERMYAVYNWNRLPHWILEAVERLRLTQIECTPALQLIKKFNYDNVFMYIDPPYLLQLRTGKQYKNELSEEDHYHLLQELKQSKAMIMISGYESDLYNTELKGWQKRTLQSHTEQGKARTEVIWCNYPIPDTQQLTLF